MARTFSNMIEVRPGEYRSVEPIVPTLTTIQVKAELQKIYQQLEREERAKGEESESQRSEPATSRPANR